MNIESYLENLVEWLLTSGLRILLILVLMFIVLKIAQMLSVRLLGKSAAGRDAEFQKRADTLSSVVRTGIAITIMILAAIMIMGELGIKIGPVLAAAGIVGVAVGFGAQSLVKDVISGFFILLEDQIRVGDVVQIAEKGGLVERLNLRMTVLRDLAGNVHYVPNGEITVVTNMTKEFSRYVFDIGVAYRENVDEVIDVIKRIDDELRNDPDYKDDILEPIEVFGLDQFANSAIVIKARTTTKPIKQWRVAREFNRRLKNAFDERDIEIPFPHVTLYMGEDKQGGAPPLRVNLEDRTQLGPS